MHTRRMVVAVVALCTLFVSSAAASPRDRDSARPLAEMTLGASRVDWQPAGGVERLALTVAGPGELWIRKEFPAGQSPSLSLDQNGKPLPEGAYVYELRRLAPEGDSERPVIQAGSFAIRNGGFAAVFEELETAKAPARNAPQGPGLIHDKLITAANECVGPLCVAGDDAFPILRLKGSYFVGILFDDVSDGLSYDRNWLLQANPNIGGPDHFFLQDLDAGTTPFTVFGNSPSYSLVVGTGGKVGVGTAIPAKKLHVLGSDGGTQGLIEETNGTTALRTMLELKNNGASRLNIVDSSVSATWGINNNSGNLNMLKSGTGVTAASLTGSGTLTVVQVVETSDRDMKTDIVAVQPEEILTKVSRLPLATWRFKKDEDKATHLGPMAQDFSAIFGLGHDDKHIKPLDVAGVSLAAVQALHRRVTEDTTQKDEEIAQLRRENVNLAERLAALEALVLKGGREEAEPTPAP